MTDQAKDADTSVTTLDNGVRVIMLRLPYLATVAVSVFVRSGSQHESARDNGISHFIEHMAFKGTRSRDCQRINLDAERLGAEVNAHTDKNHTAFHMRGLARDAGPSCGCWETSSARAPFPKPSSSASARSSCTSTRRTRTARQRRVLRAPAGLRGLRRGHGSGEVPAVAGRLADRRHRRRAVDAGHRRRSLQGGQHRRRGGHLGGHERARRARVSVRLRRRRGEPGGFCARRGVRARGARGDGGVVARRARPDAPRGARSRFRRPGAGPGRRGRAVRAVGERLLCDVLRRRAHLGRARDEGRAVCRPAVGARGPSRSFGPVVPLERHSGVARRDPVAAARPGTPGRPRVPRSGRNPAGRSRSQRGCGAAGAGRRARRRLAAAGTGSRSAGVARAGRESFPSRLRVAAATLLAYVVMRLGLRVGGFDPAVYRRDVVANSDFRKFDDARS